MSNPHLNSLKQNKGRKYGPSMGNSGPKTEYLSAHITEEAGWETTSSGNTLSRVFLVVLILHVLVIGGIVGYEWMKPKDQPIATTTTAPAPAPTTETTAPEAPKATPHRLQSQETLEVLEARYGVPVDYLIEYNDLNNNPLKPGMIIHIPSTELVADYKRRKAEEAQATIAKFATEADQSPEIGMVAQNLVNPQDSMPAVPAITPTEQPIAPINSGQLTEIPKARPVDEVLPAGALDTPVQTLGQPQNETGADMGASQSPPTPSPTVNSTPPKMVQSTPTQQSANSGNDRLRTPPAEPTPTSNIPKARKVEETAATPEPKVDPKVKMSGKTHKIASGETLYRIARMYKVNVNDLMKLNGITDPSKLQIGRVLKIPSK